MIDQNRYFTSNPTHRSIAIDLYNECSNLPLVCPHGHADPRLFAEPNYHFGNPVELLIQPDHYVIRIVHSQGVTHEQLGIPVKNGQPEEKDPRKIWRLFASLFYRFSATPTGLWIRDELSNVFGINEQLTEKNADAVYDAIQRYLDDPDFTPRKLYQRFNIVALSTTDSPTDDLEQHQKIAASGWPGHILPTFRADSILHIEQADWLQEVEKLSAASHVEIHDFLSYLQAVATRRAWFKKLGAIATDMAVVSAQTACIPAGEMEVLFQKGLKGTISQAEADQFIAGMIVELARMSAEDGLVMQMHVGCYRNHDLALLENAGWDMGADFPVSVELTRSLQPLLNLLGNDPRFRLILFTMDEGAYSRELAPLASYYPSLKLGPPWWFNDSLNGMQRFFDQAIDAGGIYNTVGFNDDTRAFLSVPTRHDVWRRASANWLAGLVSRQIVDKNNARQMMKALACGLALKAYGLEKYAPPEACLD